MEIWEHKPPGILWTTPGLLRDSFTFAFYIHVCLHITNVSFFFFSRHCNTCRLWPAQLWLSILSRKVFKKCRCQRHVKPPTWRTKSRHQVSPTSETTRENPQQRKVRKKERNCREFCRKWRLPRHFWVLLHAVNLRHCTDGFTSPPKEGAPRIFCARKIRQLRPGLNPQTWVLKDSTLPIRPPKHILIQICSSICSLLFHFIE